jgi:hypothetical protein
MIQDFIVGCFYSVFEMRKINLKKNIIIIRAINLPLVWYQCTGCYSNYNTFVLKYIIYFCKEDL